MRQASGWIVFKLIVMTFWSAAGVWGPTKGSITLIWYFGNGYSVADAPWWLNPQRLKPRRSRANLRPRSQSASVIDRLLKNQNPLENRNNLRSSSPHSGPGQTSGEPRDRTACPSEELDPAGTSNSMNFRLTEQKSTLFQWLAVHAVSSHR
jgi:hypothetical protein